MREKRFTLDDLESMLLTTSEAAQLLNVSGAALFKWRKEESGPRYVKIGPKLVRYRRADLIEWIETRRVKGVLPC